MAQVTKSIDVDQPISTVYNQWTQFQSFPEFMEGVEKVDQLDNKRLHWQADIGMAEREWDAEITEQVPDQVIAWKSVGEVRNGGRVSFTNLGDQETRVELIFEYEPSGMVEKIGDKAGVVDKRIEGDLQRFKKFIESRGTETGGWRGEVH